MGSNAMLLLHGRARGATCVPSIDPENALPARHTNRHTRLHRFCFVTLFPVGTNIGRTHIFYRPSVRVRADTHLVTNQSIVFAECVVLHYIYIHAIRVEKRIVIHVLCIAREKVYTAYVYQIGDSAPFV